jgi:hypothetical protein
VIVVDAHLAAVSHALRFAAPVDHPTTEGLITLLNMPLL